LANSIERGAGSQPASVSIIVVTCNSQSTVFDCLSSLKQSAGADQFEIIVVDNHSSDAALERLAREFVDIKLIANDRNLGFAAACNIGVRVATAPFLLFVNPDVVVDADAIPSLLLAARNRQRVGAIAGRLRFPDGRWQANCRKFPTIGNLMVSRGSIVGKLLPRGLFSKIDYYTLPDYPEVTEVPAVAGTFMLIRRDLFLLAHGFDARFFMYMEDTDLSQRLFMSGFLNLYVPQAGAIHGWGKGSSAGKLRRAWHHHQSLWRYFLKHYPTGFSLILLPVLLSLNLLITCILPERER
jgi:GT2 family glycosyltransferase